MSGRLRGVPIAFVTLFISPGAVVVPAIGTPAPSPVASLSSSTTPSLTDLGAGAVIHARKQDGSPIPGAVVFIYHSHPAGDGPQKPVGTGITDATGDVTIPLPAPTTDSVGVPGANYVATYFGLGAATTNNGIKYFAVTPDTPLPVVTVENNLPQSPCAAPSGISAVDPNQWGYDVTTDANGEGNVHVATAHGSGSWSGNPIDLSGLEGSSAEAIGELASTNTARTTLGTVGMRVHLPGVPIPDGGGWNNDGFMKFEFDSTTNKSNLNEFDVEQAGSGAVAIVAPATWAHSTESFKCPAPGGGETSFQVESVSPLTWDAARSAFKETEDASKDTFAAMTTDPFSIAHPVSGGIDFATGTGRGQAYGTDVSIEVAPVVGYNFSSETHYDGTTLVHFYSGNGCGQSGSEKCYYYTDPPTKTDCPDDLLCGSDFYTAVVPPTAPPPSVPGPAPRPCTPNSARNLCD